MCKPGHIFKFCTCPGKALNNVNTWRLSRNSIEETEYIRKVGGLTAPPRPAGEPEYFHEDGFIIARLLHDLNNNEVFDFEYHPSEGDLLSVSIGDNINLDLIFSNDEFIICYTDFVKESGETIKIGDVNHT